MLLQLSQLFPLCLPLPGSPPYLQQSTPPLNSWVMQFGFSISYTIPNIPLSILYLPVMLLNPCTFSPILYLCIPVDNPPNELHIYDSIPILVICLVCFFRFTFDSCEFVAVLMFIVLIFFLNRSV